MGRPARFIPENTDGVLVEVTCRVIGARAMLVPSPNSRTFNEVIVGVVGRALEISPLELCSAVWMANHAHLLCVVRDQPSESPYRALLPTSYAAKRSGDREGPFPRRQSHLRSTGGDFAVRKRTLSAPELIFSAGS